MNERLQTELNNLNANQKEAVTHQGGPLFVVAGAGTGKTKALTTRIAYLIEKLNVHPDHILGVTFTNKAAREIKERVNNLVYPAKMGSWLYTFHAFGLRVLRLYAEDLNLGYHSNFTVIDIDDGLSIIRDIMKRHNIDTKKYTPRFVLNCISSHKTKIEMISDVTIERIYDFYCAELIKEQLMDFDDLIVYTYNLLRDNTSVRTNLQNQFEHILIDEFQDTDKIQYGIIKLLANQNTFVVGDPDQSIYSFRGARYENNELFLKDFNAKEIVLDQNYRSTNNILKGANLLIANNQSKAKSKKLVSDFGDGEQIIITQTESDYDEVNYITNEVIRLKRLGYEYQDIAILYRNNHLSRLFEHNFRQAQIPYQIYGGLSYYERKEVKDILAYLQLIVDNKSNFYLKRIINVPTRGIGNVTLTKLEDYANNYNIPILESIGAVNISSKANASLNEFKQMIFNMKEAIIEAEDLVDIIDIIFKMSGYRDMLKEDKDDKADERKTNILELKNIFRYGSWHYEGTNLEKIKSVLDEIALYTDHDVEVKDDNVVRLATVHQVKGLEFKVVFVVAVEDGLFPNIRVFGSQFELEEERRVFYVAVTRAKERLYITNAQRRMLYGNMTYNGQSRFVRELKEVEIYNARPKVDVTKMAQTSNKVSKFKTGDLVNHIDFGDGIIVELKGEVATIAFSVGFGIKKLMVTHPSISKK